LSGKGIRRGSEGVQRWRGDGQGEAADGCTCSSGIHGRTPNPKSGSPGNIKKIDSKLTKKQPKF